MVRVTVKPPEYYPVVDKVFIDGLIEALEALGVGVTDIKAGVVPTEDAIRVGFLIGIKRPDTFSGADVNSIISALLEKLAAEARETLGAFYNTRFDVVGFKIIEKGPQEGKKNARLVIDCPDDMKRTLQRLGKGLMIHLKEKGVDFSTLVISVPKDGRPKVTVVVLLTRSLHLLEKEHLAESLTDKGRSYLRTLSADYMSLEVQVLDPGDKTVAMVLRGRKDAEKEAEQLLEDRAIREIMEALGKKPREP